MKLSMLIDGMQVRAIKNVLGRKNRRKLSKRLAKTKIACITRNEKKLPPISVADMEV